LLDLTNAIRTDLPPSPGDSPSQPENDVDSAENPPSEIDFTTAILMFASLPLSDDEKVEAIRQLAGRDACLGILLSSVATSKTHGERPCFYSADESGHLRPDNFFTLRIFRTIWRNGVSKKLSTIRFCTESLEMCRQVLQGNKLPLATNGVDCRSKLP